MSKSTYHLPLLLNFHGWFTLEHNTADSSSLGDCRVLDIAEAQDTSTIGNYVLNYPHNWASGGSNFLKPMKEEVGKNTSLWKNAFCTLSALTFACLRSLLANRQAWMHMCARPPTFCPHPTPRLWKSQLAELPPTSYCGPYQKLSQNPNAQRQMFYFFNAKTISFTMHPKSKKLLLMIKLATIFKMFTVSVLYQTQTSRTRENNHNTEAFLSQSLS